MNNVIFWLGVSGLFYSAGWLTAAKFFLTMAILSGIARAFLGSSLGKLLKDIANGLK